MLFAVRHSEAAGWSKVDDLATVSDIRSEPGALLWAEMDVADITEEEVHLVAEEFGLHELAVEDATKPRQRPKLERYPNHLFLVVHQLDEVEDQLEAVQMACFIGRRFLLIIHAGAGRLIDAMKERWSSRPEDLKKGAPFLVHGLLDALVDDYQAIADRLEEEVEELEELTLAARQTPIERELYVLKQQLARMRRYALPVTRALDWIVNGSARELLPREITEYFRDVHDHLMRISEQVNNVDELTQAVLDLQKSEQAEVLNRINRNLSAWAAIFAVETLIAGVYGMNFALVPEEGSLFGFWFAVTLMVALGVGLFVFFRNKRWL
jgi:magnesium transporter